MCGRLTIINAVVLNPGGPKSGTSPDVSVSDVVNKETDELLEEANKKGDFGTRHQEVLKTLVRIHSFRSYTIRLSPYQVVI